MLEEVVESTESIETIDQIPTEELTVEVKPINPQSKVGTKEFNEALYNLLANGKSVWRTSTVLAEKMGVDTKDLDSFLKKQQIIVCRPSKEEGIFLYALANRFKEDDKGKDKTKIPSRLIVSEEDRYTLGSLNSCSLLLDVILRKHALGINAASAEAFTMLVAAKEKMDAGVYLLAAKQQADITKLPGNNK